MNVDYGFSAQPSKDGPSIPTISSDRTEATPTTDLPCHAHRKLLEDGPEDDVRGEDKFGVHKEAIFDFRDYGLD